MRWSLLSPTDMWDTRHQWKLSNLEVVQGFSAGSLTAWIVRAPAEVGRLVDTPAGGEAAWPAPRPGLGGVVGEIPIQGRPADAEELGDIPCGVPIGFHTSCGRDVAGVGDLCASPEFGAVGTGDRPLEGGPLLDQFPFELGHAREDSDHHAPRCGESGVLLIQSLGNGADPRVSHPRPAVRS